jgi:hypothetical protein
LEGIAVKPLVVAILAGLAATTAVSADPLRLAQAEPMDVLHPREVRMMLRSQGLMPVGQPVLRGTTYVVPAIGDGDREVSVLVDARSGSILKITPVAVASRMPPSPPPRGMRPGPGPIMLPESPPPPGTTYGPYERMTPGYVSPPPSAVYRGSPPHDIMQDEPRVYGIRPPSGMPDDDPDRDAIAPPPPGGAPPRVITATPHPGAEASMPEQDAEQNDSASSVPGVGPPIAPPGVLPPPPERFPKRVAPTDAATPPRPPVKRAASAVPKQAPLPRPRPAAAAPAAPAAPTAEPESETVAPLNPQGHSEMPN